MYDEERSLFNPTYDSAGMPVPYHVYLIFEEPAPCLAGREGQAE